MVIFTAFTVVEFFVSIACFICSLLFIQPILKSYGSGRTNFLNNQRHINSHDIPTVTFCYDNQEVEEYGIDLNVSMHLGTFLTPEDLSHHSSEDQTSLSGNLFLDIPTKIDRLLLVKIERIWTDNNFHQVSGKVTCCYKISILKTFGSDRYNPDWFFRIQVDFSRDAPPQGTVYFTSESNSYGVVRERWYDGSVAKSDFKGYFRGAVTGTDEYHYLDCSTESYYECLGRRFANWNFEATNLWCHSGNRTCYEGKKGEMRQMTEPNLRQCTFKELCIPISLPKLENLPHCGYFTNKLEWVCALHIIEKLRMSQEWNCNKLCSVTEYKMRVESSEPTMGNYDLDIGDSTFIIDYGFTPPDATKVRRHDFPFKTVHEEYLILDEMAMIGSVGGTLGLFTGFSFFGATVWTLVRLTKLAKWINSSSS